MDEDLGSKPGFPRGGLTVDVEPSLYEQKIDRLDL